MSRTPPKSSFVSDSHQVHLPALTSFQRAIRYTTNMQIHEINGRAIVIGTDVYYSPNSSRTPPAPLPPRNLQYTRDPLEDCVEEFHNPQWWKTDTGYLPFLPTSPQFGSSPFNLLYNSFLETGTCRKRRVRMNSNDVLNWGRLEMTLTHIFKSFQSTYCIPDMPPIIRTSLACQETFEYPSQFLSAEKQCRNWFAIWMAMVSLGIAVAEVYDGDDENTMVPKWYSTFVQHTDEAVLAGVRQQLGQFNSWFPRAGVFLNLCNSEEQPTVDFFVRFNIPVWYPWGSAEESHALKNPSYWTRYIPPAHMLQRARSFLYVVPGPASSNIQDLEEDLHPWTVFLANRARRATGPIPTNKPAMKVFHWEKDEIGKWQRIAVLKQLRSETLAEYGKSQKVFDERTNEWDCCTDMGELDAEIGHALDDEGDEPILSTGQGLLPSAPNMSNGEVETSIHSEISHPNAALPEESAICLPARPSLADVLYLFFGFIAPPQSVCLDLPEPSDQQVKDLALGIGCSDVDSLHSYVQSRAGRYAPNFFWSISQSPWIPPPNALFDLAAGNPRAVQHRRRMKFLRQLPGGIFLFDFGREATVDWHICVTDISLALLIVRLDDELCDYNIARSLLDQGSPFWTALDSASFDIIPSPPGIPRLRLSSYQFSAEDYHMYCHDRAQVLRNPRVSRQALMHGGILWRLVMEYASAENVLTGPTSTATIHRQCRSFNIGRDRFYIDDVLTVHEIEVICGMYYVYTGKISI